MISKPTQDSRLDQNGTDTETTCPFWQASVDEQSVPLLMSSNKGIRWIVPIYRSAKQTSERDNHRHALMSGRFHESVPTNASCGAIASEAQADGGTAVWKIVSKSDEREESTQGHHPETDP